jgi:hypothetical protein
VLHVDCSADGLARRPARPVFAGDHITLQPVTFCQPVMSAAMLGNIEMLPIDDDRKNKMSHPTPHPMVPHDYFVTVIAMAENLIAWFPMQAPWLMRSRLSVFCHVPLLEKIRFAFAMLRWFFGSVRAAKRFLRDLEDADRVY